MPKYRDLAAVLRDQIERGELPPGEKLPYTDELVTQYGYSKHTVRAAVQLLVDEGLVIARRRYGTVVRDRRKVRIPLNRYQRSLDSQGQLGPFEAACKEQGLNGEMGKVTVERVRDPDVAARLGLPSEDALVCRRRQALIDKQTVQFQSAWYPIDVAETANLEREGRIEGGIYRALIAAGIPAVEADERVIARAPTNEEAAELGTGTGIPVITIERISKDGAGRPLEFLRVVAAADRLELSYDALPLPGREAA
jgi:GntR family transcriptional regulator